MYRAVDRTFPGLGKKDTGGTAAGAGQGAVAGAYVAGPWGAVVGGVIGGAMSYFQPGAGREPSQAYLAKEYREMQLKMERADATARIAAADEERARILKYTALGGGTLLLLAAAGIWLATRSR